MECTIPLVLLGRIYSANEHPHSRTNHPVLVGTEIPFDTLAPDVYNVHVIRRTLRIHRVRHRETLCGVMAIVVLHLLRYSASMGAGA
jgi:hypothetical protein